MDKGTISVVITGLAGQCTVCACARYNFKWMSSAVQQLKLITSLLTAVWLCYSCNAINTSNDKSIICIIGFYSSDEFKAFSNETIIAVHLLSRSDRTDFQYWSSLGRDGKDKREKGKEEGRVWLRAMGKSATMEKGRGLGTGEWSFNGSSWHLTNKDKQLITASPAGRDKWINVLMTIVAGGELFNPLRIGLLE